MHKALLLFTFLMFFGNSHAQSTYAPFLNTTDWYIMMASQAGSFPFWINQGADTVVNATTYKKYHILSGTDYYLAREDTLTRQVYTILPSTSAERLLYDFNLTQGMQVQIQLISGSGTPTTFEVDSVDQVQILGGTRKRLFLTDIVWSGNIMIWIEGLGSTTHPFYSHYMGFSDPVFWDICAYESTTQIYFNNGAEPCPVFVGIADNYIQPAEMEVLSTTDALQLNILNANALQVAVYSLDGRLLLEQHDQTNNQFKLNTSTWTPGIYLVAVQLENGASLTYKFARH
jgi:hypothetical protein